MDEDAILALIKDRLKIEIAVVPNPHSISTQDVRIQTRLLLDGEEISKSHADYRADQLQHLKRTSW